MLTDELKAHFDNITQNNDVVIFMKGTPSMPVCGFSARAVGCFGQVGVAPEQIFGVNILETRDTNPALCEYSDWPTFPQIYIKGEFIGGGDILLEMLQAGELKDLLVEKQILAA
jgi:monothiol glutaredoxin